MATKVIRRQINKPKGSTTKQHYSDKQKYEAVVAFLAIGNMAIVADATGIPHDRLRQWKQLPWWKDIEAQVRNQHRVEVTGKLNKIIDKAAKVIEDRLENGDYRVSKKGELLRIPVNAKTAGDILAKSIDKHVLMEKIAERPDIQEEAVADRLESIAKRLIEASKVKRSINVIDVTPEEVVSNVQ